ncbi:MAG: tripartite tricarboxylate transporter permease [Nanoarchaeota archaeon]|nr:tripartite tricarboxylate transporter permease [Nanoarchaeota archaeon]
MGIELFLALFLGIAAGIITGLTPGIHVNLVAALAVSSGAVLFSIASPLAVAVFIISLAITHTFLDAIPSIYLGAPDESQALNVLPGHRLLLRGEGHNAITYTVIGSLGCLFLSLIILPLFIVGAEKLYPFFQAIIGYALIALMGYMIWREKRKRLKSLVAFLLAGSLGLLVFSVPNLNQPLLPLLSGLFGTSLLLLSIAQKVHIPRQNVKKKLSISGKNAVKSVAAATGMGSVAAFLPGFGNAQAAIVATSIVGDIGDEGFLSLVGGLNTASMVLSIGAYYAIEKARNGAIVAVQQLIGSIGIPELLLFLGVALAAGGTAALLTLFISKRCAQLIRKIPYAKLAWGVIAFIALLSVVFDGFPGLAILGTATALGVLVSSWGVGKNHLMGCLIVPVILYFVL